MDKLRQQVRRARRRLMVQQLLNVASWTVFGALLLAVVAVAVPRIWPMSFDVRVWSWTWLGGSVVVGLVVAVIWTWATGRSGLDAAIEIDQRFGLRERISSTLSLGPDELQSEMGRALVEDAAHRIDRIDVTDRFPIRGRWLSLLPLVPAAAVFLVMAVGQAEHDRQGQAGAAPMAAKKQIRNSTKQLQHRLAVRRKKADEAGLKDAGDLLKKLEVGVGQLAAEDEKDQEKALAKLNDLADELRRRRQQLGSRQQIFNQLSALKNIQMGPADKLARAIKDGDFGKALDQLKSLQRQLRNQALTDQQQAAVAKQLNQMAETLRRMAEAHQQAKQQLERQIEQRMKKGDMAGAGQLQRKLDQLNAQNQKMDGFEQMAQQLGQCAQCTKAGDGQKAAEQLEGLAAGLEKMQAEFDELEMLDDALDQIDLAKDAMACKNCNGLGCAMCQGLGPGGMGLGEGQGQGPRPEQKTDANFYQSQVRAKVGRGKAVVVDSVPGKNIAGQAREEIKAAIDGAKRSSDDPLVDQRIPRQYRQQVEQYFDTFRKGDKRQP